MNLILFGFKGCGKTHFGKLFAQKMHRSFIDTDDWVVEHFAKRTGRRILLREIYTQIGPERFRSFESEVLQFLKTVKDSIIALGGGAVLDRGNVEFLQTIGCLVYLSTNAEILQQRVLKSGSPAFLDARDPKASFLEIYQERRWIYESIPAARIDCDALDEAGILASLQSLLILQDPPNGL